MTLLTIGLIVFIAALHIYFMIVEMFHWDKPHGLKVFGHSLEDAKRSKVLAQNQGLYNGFLSAGLIWGLVLGLMAQDGVGESTLVDGTAVSIFFLACIFLAGVYGYITTKNAKIIVIQATPAALALGLLLF